MNVFVNYRSTNRKQVDELVADLKALGHEVWYDQDLEGGQKWWDNILEQIRFCDVLVFAMTREALESRSCQAENNYAHALHKHIVPVLLDRAVQVSLLPLMLQERHIVDYTNPGKDAYKALLHTLERLPATPPLPNPLPAPPPIPISPLVPIKDQIDQPSLTLEQQVTLAHQLKGFLYQKEYDVTARQLLERLREHPSLYANVLREIEETLAAPPPAPQPIKPAPAPRPAAPRYQAPPQAASMRPTAAPAKKSSTRNLILIGLAVGICSCLIMSALVLNAVLQSVESPITDLTANDYNNRGLTYLNQGCPSCAIEEFNYAIELNPNFKEAYYNRAAAYQQLGNFNAAQADMAMYNQLLLQGY